MWFSYQVVRLFLSFDLFIFEFLFIYNFYKTGFPTFLQDLCRLIVYKLKMTAWEYYPKVFSFKGEDFKMWRMQMEYLLKVMRILYVLYNH